MSIRTIRNLRNETASTDGRIWWLGTATDEHEIAIGELQPVSTLFPCAEGKGAIPTATVAKARAVFIASLRKSSPTVAPSDDAERAILRKAWDDAQAFAASHIVLAVGKPVFDAKLMLIGTADAIYEPEESGSVTYCYSPSGYEWAGELNAVVRMLHHGLPFDCADDPHDHYTLRNVSRALLALVTRGDTEWFRNHVRAF